jgi:hypothetical protein
LTKTGWHRFSVAYTSSGHRRYNQPFTPTNYGPQYVQGDVIGVGYRPRTGTVFFTRNGKKLDEVAHGLKSQNLFPTVGANGPCTVHANFGQMGFVYIEANVKKWGLAPMTGSLAPPPPYGSEQGSILLEGGRDGGPHAQGGSYAGGSHSWSRNPQGRLQQTRPPASPGPVRSPTDISLAHLAHIPSHDDDDDAGEGTSGSADQHAGLGVSYRIEPSPAGQPSIPPPEYTSPEGSHGGPSRRESVESQAPMLRTASPKPPIPSYDAAVGNERGRQG